LVATKRNILKKIAGHSISLLCFSLLLTIINVSINHNLIDNYTVAYASSAENTTTKVDSSDRRVYDEAELLNIYEIEELESMCHDYGEKAGIEIYILTHNDKNATYPEKYIEDFEDQLPVEDRVYFLYDVYNNEIFMEGYGLAETYIHSKRIDIIFDNVADYLRGGYYYDAFKTYIRMSADYMADESELNYDHDYVYDNYNSIPYDNEPEHKYTYHEYDYDGHYRREDLKNNLLFNFWFQLIAAFAVGGIVVGIMAYHSSGRMTAGAKDYLDRSRGGLIGRRDQYIKSSVIRWRKPQDTSSSGGGSGRRGGFNAGGFRGGVSGGGRSHSSGGRKL
jgi:uncharacterized protein